MERLGAELNEEKRRRKEAEMTSRALATDAEDTKTKNAALQKVILKRFSHIDFLNAPPMLLFSFSSFSFFCSSCSYSSFSYSVSSASSFSSLSTFFIINGDNYFSIVITIFIISRNPISIVIFIIINRTINRIIIIIIVVIVIIINHLCRGRR